jgi:hypothetical protein
MAGIAPKGPAAAPKAAPVSTAPKTAPVSTAPKTAPKTGGGGGVASTAMARFANSGGPQPGGIPTGRVPWGVSSATPIGPIGMGGGAATKAAAPVAAKPIAGAGSSIPKPIVSPVSPVAGGGLNTPKPLQATGGLQATSGISHLNPVQFGGALSGGGNTLG